MAGWIVALALCHSLDVGTTLTAFHRGGVEVNPLAPSKPAFVVGVHVGMGSLQIWKFKQLVPQHPKLAKGVVLAEVGIACGAGIWNLHQLTK